MLMLCFRSPYYVVKTFLSYVVVLFPAFDVLSVTPMNTIALASNIMSAYYGNR